MPGPNFIHLRVHSSYSLLEGALTIGRLAELAKADKQPALALTDTGNMFGALEFSEKMAGAGIQPIIGCSLAVDFGDQTDDPARRQRARRLSRIVLLATREEGYRSLMRLNSRAFLETPPHETAHLKLGWLDGETEHLIALTGGALGPLGQALAGDQSALAAARCDKLRNAVRRPALCRVAAPRHAGRARWSRRRSSTSPMRAGCRWSRPTSRISPTADDYEAHDALLAIAEGRLVAETDRRQLTPEHHFKTRAEMAALFADLPEALASTVEIARRCAFRPTVRKPILPRFTTEVASDAAAAEADEMRRAGGGGARTAPCSAWSCAGPDGGSLSRAARLRDRRHHPHELSPATS